MTPEEIRKAYTTNERGMITQAGQFEGEMIYLPHFWQAYLDGCADSDDGTTLTFKILPEDRKVFPEIPKRRRTIRLQQTNDGFIREV